MLTTILAVMFIDKLGRKPIMYFGFTVMILALCTAGYIFHTEAGLQVVGQHLSVGMKNTLLGSTLVYIFAFAISAGPIMWVICAEIFPLKGRDLGMTITTAVKLDICSIGSSILITTLSILRWCAKPSWRCNIILFLCILLLHWYSCDKVPDA